MKQLFTLLVILFSLTTSFQDKKSRQKEKNDELSRKVWGAYSESYTISTQLRDTLNYYTDIYLKKIDLDTVTSNPVILTAYSLMLYKYLHHNEQDSVDLVIEKLNGYEQQFTINQRINLQRNIGIAYDHNNNVPMAIKTFFKALEISVKSGSQETHSITRNINYILNNRFSNTPNWLEKKQSIYKHILEAFSLESDFEFTLKRDQVNPYEKILYQLPTKSIFFPEYENDLNYTKANLTKIIELKEQKKDSSHKAIAHKTNSIYEQTIAYFDDKNNNLYYNLLNSYIIHLTDQKLFQKASKYIVELDSLLPTNIGYDYFDNDMFLDNAVLTFMSIKNYEKAIYFMEKNKIYESNYTINSNENYTYLTQYLKLIDQKQKESKKTKKQQRETLILIIGFAITSLISLFMVLKVRSNRKLIKLNKTLLHSKNKVINTLNEKKNLENRLAIIETTVNKDLHDNFGNKLSGVLNSLEIMKDITEKENFNSKLYDKFKSNFEFGISSLSHDIKDLVWANNPENNSLFNLLVRLENRSTLEKGVTLKINNQIPEDIELPRYWNRQLLLIFKEAITNATKHSGAKTIELSSYINTKNQLVLSCIDTGNGWDMTSNTRRSGIYNMQKRAQAIESELEITSIIDKGTTVSFTSSKLDNSAATR